MLPSELNFITEDTGRKFEIHEAAHKGATRGCDTYQNVVWWVVLYRNMS